MRGLLTSRNCQRAETVLSFPFSVRFPCLGQRTVWQFCPHQFANLRCSCCHDYVRLLTSLFFSFNVNTCLSEPANDLSRLRHPVKSNMTPVSLIGSRLES
ncbi:hypothetical protein BaRGS_00031967 [Batillaria attramentaria]|uniref:Uncharacterized protein n=1 Tax=Batillaria attramentaria TaxID=370345 RepID=A0ABD0JQ00_9CAEN